MPLIHGKSPKAFKKNIEAEMHAGKPQKQSLAIAYSIKRKAEHSKKMAKGGMVHPDADNAKTDRDLEMMDKHPLDMSPELDARKEHMATIDSGDEDDSEDMRMLKGKKPEMSSELDARKEGMADIDSGDDNESEDMRMMHGMHGDIEPDLHDEQHMPTADEHDDMIDRIMMKRKMMAKGGMAEHDDEQVDLHANQDEGKNLEDDLSFEALHDPMKDSMIDGPGQPMDSNEHGHEIDSDEHDMVDLIRRKMMSRRRS